MTWGPDRHAVRDYLKEVWMDNNETEENTAHWVSDSAKARREANGIVTVLYTNTHTLTIDLCSIPQWWWEVRYPGNEDKDSRFFARWLLREYRKHCQEREKVDPFNHTVDPPRY